VGDSTGEAWAQAYRPWPRYKVESVAIIAYSNGTTLVCDTDGVMEAEAAGYCGA
jgi:hypothetical protein